MLILATLLSSIATSGNALGMRASMLSQRTRTDAVEAAAAELTDLVHVSHTHSSSRDIWHLGFDALGRYARKGALGERVKFYVCVDQHDSRLENWPWLTPIVYGDETKASLYPQKVANCLKAIQPQPKFVLHTMEDFVLGGDVEWSLVAASVKLLKAMPLFSFFGLEGAQGAPPDENCTWTTESISEHTSGRVINSASAKLPSGACTPLASEIAVMDEFFPGFTVVADTKRWIQFHEKGAALGHSSFAQMEQYHNEGHYDFPGVGLYGFQDTPEHYDPLTEHVRKYAYPAIHSAVLYGMWDSGAFAPFICPYLAAQNISEAGLHLCGYDPLVPVAEPKCLCNDDTSCKTGDPEGAITILRKVAVHGDTVVPFPSGCTSWKKQGSPLPAPMTQKGAMLASSLSDAGFWDV